MDRQNERFSDPFIKILPTIDVHGETSDTVTWIVKDFIGVNLKLQKYKIVIIHGRHSDILKKKIHAYLHTDKRVEKYYIYGFNDGLTIVELKKES